MSWKLQSVYMGMTDVATHNVLLLLKSVMRQCANIELNEGGNLLQHSLWVAYQAQAAGCESPLVVAALFHDIGHCLCAGDPELPDYYRDREHAALAATWLSRWFPASVCAPVAMHIDAKRYLATVDPAYRMQLGRGSKQSLENQGGLMTEHELSAFSSHRQHEQALLVRVFDDAPYVGECLPPYTRYERIVRSVMR
ncbi:HD domain-containing protein [Pseudomonas putida]|uniref:HD domain-containing protein n=1 Tax=Pseudomonas putida TaxID=303 RepID=A0A4D6X9P9_PSEPU|nr:HD domain-containing protein [Pseudomonas putida]QCI12664.1 HD domain-containing protein [Pseudomonas putida]